MALIDLYFRGNNNNEVDLAVSLDVLTDPYLRGNNNDSGKRQVIKF